MMAGTTFSWTSLIWQKVRMAQIMSRRCGCKFMQTADFAEFTSLTASTQRRSCRLSSSSTFLSKWELLFMYFAIKHFFTAYLSTASFCVNFTEIIRIQRAWRDFGDQEAYIMSLWGSLSHDLAVHLPSWDWDPEKYQNVSVSFLLCSEWLGSSDHSKVSSLNWGLLPSDPLSTTQCY